MSKQQSFFLSKFEIFQKEHPEKFEKKSSGRKSAPKVFDCSTCGLDKKCRNPRIKRFGKGKKKILFIGMCPGASEDRVGVPFVGTCGGFLKRTGKLLDIDLDTDCERTNIVGCYPGKDIRGHDKEPTENQIKCCSKNLEKDIQEVQPKLIICLGELAIKTVLQTEGSMQFSTEMMHGKVIPYHKYNCWVGSSYHPSFYLRRKDSERDPDDGMIFAYDLAKMLNYLDEPLPQPLTSEGNECITDPDEAIQMLEHLCDSEKPVSFDYEANRLSSHSEDPRILSISLTNEIESAIFIPIGLRDKSINEYIFNLEEQAMIVMAMRNFLRSDAPKVVQNYNMEELWSRNIIGQPMNNFIHDTMVTAHVINCHPRTTGLAFQAFEMTGHEYKHLVDYEDLENASIEDICNLNCWDSRYTLMSYYRQKPRLEGNMIGFNDFFTSSLPVLANFKDRGIKIDLDELDNLETMFNSGMDEYKSSILTTVSAQKFKAEKGKELEITSPTQLGQLIYDICKVEKTKKRRTAKTGRGATGESVLQEILDTTENSDVKIIISSLFTYRRNTKVIERIAEYRRLIDPEGFVHPSYNLNMARSYRSSADGPSIQNVFMRDDEQRKFRRCIIPLPGNIWLEADYDGIEVRVIGMVSGCPELIREIIKCQEWDNAHPEGGPNPFDTHRKWAAKLFEKDYKIITKQERYRGKNEFVFPRFYGATEGSIARSFSEKPKEHIVEVCREFWNEYPGVKEWQLRTISEYKKYGYVELVTGARRPGPLSINKLYNTPIQGPAFHLTLDALRIADEEIQRRKLKSLLRIEVHDSITSDTVPEEAEEITDLTEKIMISKRFDWQRNVPLSVSWEIGSNWYEMGPL